MQPGLVLGFLLFVAWFLAEASIHAHTRRAFPRDRKDRSQDRGSAGGIVLACALTLAATWVSLALGVLLLPAAALLPGLALMAGGIATRCWALLILGRHFSPVVQTRPDQEIIRSGPYRWVRHPAYTGLLFAAIGYPVLVQSGAGLLLALVLIGGAIGYRIRVEEAALTVRFGEDYRVYASSTWRLIPYVF